MIVTYMEQCRKAIESFTPEQIAHLDQQKFYAIALASARFLEAQDKQRTLFNNREADGFEKGKAVAFVDEKETELREIFKRLIP